jgi:hypothetical protein
MWSGPRNISTAMMRAWGNRPDTAVSDEPLYAHTVGAVQRRIRSRVLRIAVHHGALTDEAASDLARWSHGGGFSLHASVLIEAANRAGLERLLRYCARPAFASERLTWGGSDQPVRYRLRKPLPTGQTELTLTPLELLDRLAALVPPPRRHRHHYAGVFAPHASLRSRVTACAGQPVTETVPVTVPVADPVLPAPSSPTSANRPPRQCSPRAPAPRPNSTQKRSAQPRSRSISPRRGTRPRHRPIPFSASIRPWPDHPALGAGLAGDRRTLRGGWHVIAK